MLNPFPYPPKPQTAQRRMWKMLGIIAQNQSGWVEAHYALETFNGDLDVDREAELRHASLHLLNAVTRDGSTPDHDAVYAMQMGRNAHALVRLQGGYWSAEPVVLHET